MKPLKFKRFEIRKPRYDPHPEKSLTKNSSWRQGLFLVFEDYDGVEYDFMPKWDHVQELNKKKEEIEIINKELARNVYFKKIRSEAQGSACD